MPDLTEDEFKAKPNQFLNDLRQRVKNLMQSETMILELTNLLDSAASDLKKQNTSAAFDKYTQAVERIQKAEISMRSNARAWALLWVELGYLLLLLSIGYATYRWPVFDWWKDFINLNFETVWFGALGGATIAIYGIYTHIQVGDFNPRFQLWYVCKPIMGGIFGWFVYLIYDLGIVMAQGVSNVQRPQIAFVIAFLAGFSERFTIKMIDKLMAVLTTFEEKGKGEAKSVVPK